MKHTLMMTLSVALLMSVHVVAQGITFGNVSYNIDTIASYPVGPGSEYLRLRFNRTNTTQYGLDVFVLRVDTRNPYVSIEQHLGKEKVVGTERPSSMAERTTTSTHIAFAGTNGDFFATTGDVGRPTGLTIENNEYAYIGSTNRRVGGVTDKGKPIVATNWKYSGRLYTAGNSDTLVIKHVNYNRNADELVLYNQYQGENTATNQYGTEVLVALCEGEQWKTHGRQKVVVLQKEQNKGSMAIPAGQAVLSGHGEMQKALDSLVNVGDTLTIRFTLKLDNVNTSLSQAIGGDNYALIVDSGVVETSNFWNEIHPRTGYGVSQTGDTALFCVVDGRTSQSYGCTTGVLGEIMRYYGAWRAVNWDGGGSSSMYVRGWGSQVNNGSDGSERAVGNAMLVVASLPEEVNEVAQLIPYYSVYSLPYCGFYTPHFIGYNKYGVMVDTDVQGVTLSCSESVGEIRDNGMSFFASTKNGGVVVATKGNAKTEIEIRIVPGNMHLKYDSVVIDTRSDWQVEVINVNKDGEQVVLAPALNWESLNKNVCEVDEDGFLRAVGNGKTQVVGSLENLFADTMLVSVETSDSPVLNVSEVSVLDGWEVASMSNFNPQLSMQNGALNLSFNFSVTRKPYVLFEKQIRLYGIPDTIKINFDTDAEIDNAQLMLLSAAGQNCMKSVTDIKSGINLQIVIPVSDLLLSKESKEHYPLSFKQLRFYLSSATTAGEHYVRINSVTLCYQGLEITALDNIYKSSLVVYPVPSSDCIHIEGADSGSDVKLYDIQGNTVVSTSLGSNGTLDISSVSSGIYILQVNAEKVIILKK